MVGMDSHGCIDRLEPFCQSDALLAGWSRRTNCRDPDQVRGFRLLNYFFDPGSQLLVVQMCVGIKERHIDEMKVWQFIRTRPTEVT